MLIDPATLADYHDRICRTSIDDAKNYIRTLLERPEGREPKLDEASKREILEGCLAVEVRGSNRASLKNAIKSALKQLNKPAKKKAEPIDGKAQLVAPADLPAIVTALETLEEGIRQIERRSQLEQLPLKVKQGYHAYRAHLHFAVKPDARKGVGGRGKKTDSRREGVSFGGWLAESAPWLKEATAYKYMTAYRGLGLADDATEADVEAAVAALVEPTLKSLTDAATQPVEPPTLPPAPPEQLTLDDYMATLKSFREDADAVIEAAKDMPENLRKVACARAYATLRALTGTAWQPAEEDDELGNIDPDNLAL